MAAEDMVGMDAEVAVVAVVKEEQKEVLAKPRKLDNSIKMRANHQTASM